MQDFKLFLGGPKMHHAKWLLLWALKTTFCKGLKWKHIRLKTYGLINEWLTWYLTTGFLIPKGWKAMPLFRNIHHNPEYFPEPQKFNPSRFEVCWNEKTTKKSNDMCMDKAN